MMAPEGRSSISYVRKIWQSYRSQNSWKRLLKPSTITLARCLELGSLKWRGKRESTILLRPTIGQRRNSSCSPTGKRRMRREEDSKRQESEKRSKHYPV